MVIKEKNNSISQDNLRESKSSAVFKKSKFTFVIFFLCFTQNTENFHIPCSVTLILRSAACGLSQRLSLKFSKTFFLSHYIKFKWNFTYVGTF